MAFFPLPALFSTNLKYFVLSPFDLSSANACNFDEFGRFNPFPKKLLFLRVYSASLLKTL